MDAGCRSPTLQLLCVYMVLCPLGQPSIAQGAGIGPRLVAALLRTDKSNLDENRIGEPCI